jgi:hypothetical protein
MLFVDFGVSAIMALGETEATNMELRAAAEPVFEFVNKD